MFVWVMFTPLTLTINETGLDIGYWIAGTYLVLALRRTWLVFRYAVPGTRFDITCIYT